MELVGKLKDEMAQAKDKDEAKKMMENAGMKLTDDELDAVAGGLGFAVDRSFAGRIRDAGKSTAPVY